jgi:hypothetical protein
MCVEIYDFASVSNIMRSVSNNVRLWPPMFSPIMRRKVSLIARRAVHHCAPLQVCAAVDVNRDDPCTLRPSGPPFRCFVKPRRNARELSHTTILSPESVDNSGDDAPVWGFTGALVFEFLVFAKNLCRVTH